MEFKWHETTRRLNDGTYLRISDVTNMPDHVFVCINSETGLCLYQGTMLITEALCEIPYQLDRAREVETLRTQTNAENI